MRRSKETIKLMSREYINVISSKAKTTISKISAAKIDIGLTKYKSPGCLVPKRFVSITLLSS